MNPAQIFADHALELSWGDIPGSARLAARTFLHDTLCVGAAGVRAAYADEMLTVAAAWGSGGDSLVLGRPGLRLPRASSAFLNAFQIHAQEFDCVHEAAVLHPMATLLGAVLGEAGGGRQLSGPDILTAIVAGCDVSIGLGLAATTPLKFFRPATSGIFGAIAAVARMRGFTSPQLMDAFGYGLALASGTMQAHQEGKPALPVQIANAARSAIVACDIAQTGVPGAQNSLVGDFGYLTLFEDGFDLAPVLAGLGRVFRISQVSWKPFPTGRAAHGGLAAVDALMSEQGLTSANLQSLTYHAPSLIARLVGRPMIPQMGVAHARLCFPYLAAVLLTRGVVGLESFAPDMLIDPNLQALAAKITVEVDDNPDPAAFVPAAAQAYLNDGRQISTQVTAQLGSPDWPLSVAQHLEKARACLAFAGLAAVHLPLRDLIDRFDTLDDARLAFHLAAGEP